MLFQRLSLNCRINGTRHRSSGWVSTSRPERWEPWHHGRSLHAALLAGRTRYRQGKAGKLSGLTRSDERSDEKGIELSSYSDWPRKLAPRYEQARMKPADLHVLGFYILASVWAATTRGKEDFCAIYGITRIMELNMKLWGPHHIGSLFPFQAAQTRPRHCFPFMGMCLR